MSYLPIKYVSQFLSPRIAKKDLGSEKIPCVCCAQSLICVQLFVTPWTVAHQTSLSMEFSRQEHQSGLSFPPPGDLPDLGIEAESLVSPALAGGFLITSRQFTDAQAPHRKASQDTDTRGLIRGAAPTGGRSAQRSRPGALASPWAGVPDARPLRLCQSPLLP